MAGAAYEKGFISIGFTSHAPQTFDLIHCIDPSKEGEYKAEIRRLKEEYAGRMAVYLGIERDMLSCSDPDDYDFFIAAVHYFGASDGNYFGVDGSSGLLKQYVDEYCCGDGLKMAGQYFSLFAAYVLNIRPDIIGHFDLVRYNNSRLHLYDEDGAAYQDMALEALRAMRETGALLEVNTGGVARGYLPDPYPALFLLRAWKEWGGEVIISSDCHDVKLLDTGYDQAEELLISLGYDHFVRLSGDPERGKWEQVGLR